MVIKKHTENNSKFIYDQLEVCIPKVEALNIKGIVLEKDLSGIAVIGSREMTSYGKEVCNYFVKELSKYFTIVSGLMYGIDIEAHKVALLSGGRTIGVLGYGFDFLEKNSYAKVVVDEILKHNNGAVISEFEDYVRPDKWTFPKRNRIVAALSKAILVIEASEKSGSLITCDFALDMNKDIFVVPGSIFSKTSKGKHELIKNGAILVDSPLDILNYYNINIDKVDDLKLDLTADERLVYKFLSREYISIDSLLIKIKSINIYQLNQIITSLELKNLIKKDILNQVALS